MTTDREIMDRLESDRPRVSLSAVWFGTGVLIGEAATFAALLVGCWWFKAKIVIQWWW